MNRESEIRELKTAMTTTQDRRMYERYLAVKLVLEGRTRKETAGIIGRSARTVGEYVSAYEENGMNGLHRKMASGRPPKLSKAERQELLKIVACQRPADVGFPSHANWTLALVAELVDRKWCKSYTPKGISKVLHSLGLNKKLQTSTLGKSRARKATGIPGRNLSQVEKTPEQGNCPSSV